MSGHSKWATIKRAKGKADAARGKVFNRIIREITIAAKMGGGDADGNPRLRSALQNAKANNMPSKNIESAIAKGTGSVEGVIYEEITFEGYAAAGVAVLVETTTDNRNRTVAEVRHAFSKFGGNLGSTNSVNWMFNTQGVVRIKTTAIEEDKLMDIVLEADAGDMTIEDDVYEVVCELDTFENVKTVIEKAGIPIESSEMVKTPTTTVKVEGETAAKVLKLMDALDELDDTKSVSGNFDIDDNDIEAFRNEK
jgi:YebC/PmpR family DNA-binding regulatory protein